MYVNKWDTSQGAKAALLMLCFINIKCAKIKTCKIVTSNHKSMRECRTQESLRIQISDMKCSH